MIIFSIDKFFDYEDYSKAAENCQEGSDELASIGIDSPALCTDIESEATKNMIESFISGSIGIGIMFIVITQQGPKVASELDKNILILEIILLKLNRGIRNQFEIQKHWKLIPVLIQSGVGTSTKQDRTKDVLILT